MQRVLGRIRVNPRGFGFLEPTEGSNGLLFVSPPDLNAFLEGDLASADVRRDDSGRLSAQGLTLLERKRTELIGRIVLRGTKCFLRPDKNVANREWTVEGAPVDGCKDGDAALARIAGDVVHLIRMIPPAEVGLERVIQRYALRSDFSELCIREAESAVLPDTQVRRDLRHIPTITIDAPYSRDLDDALSVLPADPEGALRLLVSIADVGALVTPGGALDAEALARGTSVYLAGRVLPMLPPSLSEDRLSLLPGLERPALTVELRVDPEGEIVSTDIYESLIRSTARLSYEGVAEFLQSGSSVEVPESLTQTMRWLRAAASRIGAKRMQRGGITVLRDEASVSLDEGSGEPSSFEARRLNRAHELVERLMVAANEAVALWMQARGLPALYRVHDAPEPDRVQTLATVAKNFGFEPGFSENVNPRTLAAFELQYRGTDIELSMAAVVAKLLGPARYTVFASGHFGLAAPLYLHFTSPIRRYADLAVHRVIKDYLRGGRALHADDPALEEVGQALNHAAYVATKAENERLWMLAARMFASRIGEEFDANIIGMRPFGIIAQLVRMGVTGVIPTEALGPEGQIDVTTQQANFAGGTLSVGEPIRVKVARADEDLGRIEFSWPELPR